MESDIAGCDDVDVFVGVDVGKGEHHAVALDRAGKRLFDRALANDEARSRTLIGGLNQHGRVLFVVDQPATIGALPVMVAHAAVASRKSVVVHGQWTHLALDPQGDQRADWSCDGGDQGGRANVR